jgi:hypothetical protein
MGLKCTTDNKCNKEAMNWNCGKYSLRPEKDFADLPRYACI